VRTCAPFGLSSQFITIELQLLQTSRALYWNLVSDKRIRLKFSGWRDECEGIYVNDFAVNVCQCVNDGTASICKWHSAFAIGDIQPGMSFSQLLLADICLWCEINSLYAQRNVRLWSTLAMNLLILYNKYAVKIVSLIFPKKWNS